MSYRRHNDDDSRSQSSISTTQTTRRIATFRTNVGIFRAELFCDNMPITCGNFIDLANGGFYDGIHFHRVIPTFMNQFGCPYAKDPRSPDAGTGGPPGNTTFDGCDGKNYCRNDEGCIPDEWGEPHQRISNLAGTLSMANTGEPHTGGSQFFINVRDNRFLDWFDRSTDSCHPVFAKIVENYELVLRISQVPTRNDNPVQPIQMITVRVD